MPAPPSPAATAGNRAAALGLLRRATEADSGGTEALVMLCLSEYEASVLVGALTEFQRHDYYTAGDVRARVEPQLPREWVPVERGGSA